MCYLSLVFSFTSQISLSWFKSCKIKVHGCLFLVHCMRNTRMQFWSTTWGICGKLCNAHNSSGTHMLSCAHRAIPCWDCRWRGKSPHEALTWSTFTCSARPSMGWAGMSFWWAVQVVPFPGLPQNPWAPWVVNNVLWHELR